MIESVHFKNFKALRDATLPLGRFTLIIGPNGSGKSTALKGIQATSRPESHFYLQSVTASKRGMDEETIEIIFDLTYGNVKVARQVCWRSDNSPPQVRYSGEMPTFADIDTALARTRIYSLNPQAIAASVTLNPYTEIGEDGSGLVSVLDRLRDENPERFEALNEALGRWLPEFDRILFSTPQQGMRAFSLRTREGRYSIAAADISQGTLLALALMTLAYLPDPPAVVCLEEPDRGIHPRLLRDVQDALYRLSYPEGIDDDRQPVQVIATTHSPYLLDLYRDHPEEIVIAHKEGLDVRFDRLSEQPYIDELLHGSQLGEIWYSGILGGVPTRI
ncbi:MAG: AAA family ATPase [Acidobacteria bacterium]|nr:AAA family ATPase [Acidobacteriota bacterium]